MYSNEMGCEIQMNSTQKEMQREMRCGGGKWLMRRNEGKESGL